MTRHALLLTFVFGAATAQAEHTVGNAGNPFDLMFELACERAGSMVLQYSRDTTATAAPAVVNFILDHKRALSINILSCDLRFTNDRRPIDFPSAEENCALTNVSNDEYPEGRGTTDTVYLSRPTCLAQGIDEDAANRTLIHEAIHHFVDANRSNRPDQRITDEEFCDQIAKEIFQQWLKRKNEDPRRWVPKPTLIGSPQSRAQHTAIWTGITGFEPTENKMLIWGGCAPSAESFIACGKYFNDGGIFDPKTNKWQVTETLNSPSERTLHSAVWTGANGESVLNGNMIVWGGCNGGEACSNSLNSGGVYNTEQRQWKPTPIDEGTPSRRVFHTAVWAKDRMIVWGGVEGYKNPAVELKALNDGAALIIDQDTRVSHQQWHKISNLGAPSPRMDHTAVWTGSQMIIWGGCDPKGIQYIFCTEIKGDGGIYDPATDRWKPISSVNAPSPRRRQTAVWTGRYMIVWGGENHQKFENTGALYDPVSDVWFPMNYIAPTPRALHTAVWTGNKMIIWGGSFLQNSLHVYPTDFGEYYPDPLNNGDDFWKVIRLTSQPDVAKEGTSVWTGESMVTWGGNNGNDIYFDRGGTYFTPTWE
jgi:N-acetylneuraminic acid mutarotase